MIYLNNININNNGNDNDKIRAQARQIFNKSSRRDEFEEKL